MAKRAGFSLIELLVALSILALAAAIIVPQFLKVRQQAMATSLNATEKQLNNLYAEWTAAGGTLSPMYSDSYLASVDPPSLNQNEYADAFLMLMCKPESTHQYTSQYAQNGQFVVTATDGVSPVRLTGWNYGGYAWSILANGMYAPETLGDDGGAVITFNPDGTYSEWLLDPNTGQFQYRLYKDSTTPRGDYIGTY